MVDYDVEIAWAAQPRQLAFMVRQEDEVLYGGAAGGGKTDALLADQILTCLHWPGAQCLFVRKTFSDLNKPRSAIPRAHALMAPLVDAGEAAWNGQDHLYTFRTGSLLQFGHCQHEQYVYRYQGAQIDHLAIDELTQFTEFEYSFLRMRVRTLLPGFKPKVRSGTNPLGIGHQWVKDRFITGHQPETPWTLTERLVMPGQGLKERSVSLCYIPARVWDNEELLKIDPDYPIRIASLGGDLARAYLEGDWEIFAGQYFSTWRHGLHVCEPREIPEHWPRWRAIDYGHHRPFCCLWLARDPDERTAYVYRELYEAGLTDREQAERILEVSADERVDYTLADPSCWNKQPNGQSIAQVYSECGVRPLFPANNDRIPGWTRVREYLSCKAGRKPLLQVFDSCYNLVRTMPALIRDAHRPEDLDTDGEDHAADALRYALMGGAAAHAIKAYDFRMSDDDE